MTTLAAAPAVAGRRWAPPPLAPVLAMVMALVGSVAGWRGTDLPAQLYRITMFRRTGMALWDPQWFGGHWALAYSVLYPPVAATLGVTLTAVLSAGGAALAFDRLVTARFGRSAWLGSLLFAVGTAQQLAIGQLAFLLGEALGLGACWAASRRRWPLAGVLAVGAALASPLAGAFVALAGMALVVAAAPAERTRAAVVLVGALVPIAVVAVMFPDPGPFPFSFVDFAFDVCVAIVLWALAPRGDRLLRAGAALYVAATVTCFVVHNPVGGNIGRLAECVAIPLGACVLWPRWKVVFAAFALPMALAVWAPAWGTVTGRVATMPSTHRGYYEPLVAFLSDHASPAGRVEVVPTRYHWEAAYVAPVVPLARGWERQIDIARDQLFYRGVLDAGRYRQWLLDRGVRFVALPDAPLDMAGRAEARLVAAGVPGLTAVWGDAHWRVFVLDGSTGIVSGPARLVRMTGSRVVLDISAPGAVTVRVAGGAHWRVSSGPACAAPASGIAGGGVAGLDVAGGRVAGVGVAGGSAPAGGVVVQARQPGRVVLSVRPGSARCQPRNSASTAATSSGRS